jgi:hypothetical protein
MSLAALLLLVAQPAVPPEPPRGVNSAIIGTAEENAVSGPARVCLIHTSIDIRSGETAWLDYAGIHWGVVRIEGPQGVFRVREGAFADPRRGRIIHDARGRLIRQRHVAGGVSYLIYGGSRRAPRPLAAVEGEALGHGRHAAVLARIDADRRDLSTCQRRFSYGE